MRRRTLLLALVVLGVALLTGPAPLLAQTKRSIDTPRSLAAIPGYKKQKIQGFTLLINDDVYRNNDDSRWKRKPIDVLDLELGTISRRLPERTVKLLQRIILWIEWEDRADPDLERGVVAKYYGVQGNLAQWSLGKNKHPLKANNVEVINMKSLTREHQPGVKLERCVLLHELSHAVHHQLFSNNNAIIKNTYRQAMARGLYKETTDVYGRKRTPYAARNDHEYFAELTCAYLDKLHYYPFTPEDLKEHDPQGYKLMERCWGTRKVLDAAILKKTEKEASDLLTSARRLYGMGKKKEGVTELDKLLDRFPATKASDEARKLRDQWGEGLARED